MTRGLHMFFVFLAEKSKYGKKLCFSDSFVVPNFFEPKIDVKRLKINPKSEHLGGDQPLGFDQL